MASETYIVLLVDVPGHSGLVVHSLHLDMDSVQETIHAAEAAPWVVSHLQYHTEVRPASEIHELSKKLMRRDRLAQPVVEARPRTSGKIKDEIARSKR